MLNKMLTYVKVLTFTFGVRDFMEQIKQYNAIVPIGMTCATASQLKKRNLRWERIHYKIYRHMYKWLERHGVLRIRYDD